MYLQPDEPLFEDEDGGLPDDPSLTETYLKQHGAAWDDPESLDLDDEV